VKGVRLWYPTSRTLALGAVLALVLLGLATALVMAQAQPDQALQAPQLEASAGAASPDKAPALSVTKTVDPSTVKPGESVTYTVVFSNNTPGAVVIDAITDVLPSHFDYGHLTAASSPTMTEPVDAVEPEIVWQGPFTVSASGMLTLSYQVEVEDEVEPRETPYANSVTADFEGTVSPPAEAEVTVVGPDLAVDKTASPEEIKVGDVVTYTVVFDNDGNGESVIDLITDTLPPGFVFDGMAPDGDIAESPDGSSGTITWEGPFEVPADSSLTLIYRVIASTPPLGEATNRLMTLADGEVTDPASAMVTVVAPDLTVTKTASPDEIQPGDIVAYSVVFDNDGDGESKIEVISDTLPPGFVFDSMLPDSDITDPPDGSSGTITWDGPFWVPADSSLSLAYQARASSPAGSEATNRLVALADGEVTEPVSATVEIGPWFIHAPIVMRNWTYPYFEVTKEASAAEVVKGEMVIYTVRFTNKGSGTGKLDEIRDTLPAGFIFLNMEAGSGVAASPTGTTGTLVWKGPFTVGGGQTLTLIYKVRVSDVVGLYENSVTATTLVGLPPEEPASATVKVKEPYLLWEDFESGTDGWEPFLNYWRLHPEQWYLAAGEGYNGSTGLMHSDFLAAPEPGRGAEDALYMYRGTGSEQWTDYRLEAKVRLEEGSEMGLWIRGKYAPSEEGDGKHVEGYYVTWNTKRSQGNVKLARLRTDGNTAYHFSDPILLADGDRNLDNGVWYNVAVVVDEDHIQVYIDGGEPIIDYYDSTFAEGTVGFFCYKVAYGIWDEILVTPLP
jgi:uncharacterized repeat protein (TIGR01451 family)